MAFRTKPVLSSTDAIPPALFGVSVRVLSSPCHLPPPCTLRLWAYFLETASGWAFKTIESDDLFQRVSSVHCRVVSGLTSWGFSCAVLLCPTCSVPFPFTVLQLVYPHPPCPSVTEWISVLLTVTLETLTRVFELAVSEVQVNTGI